MEVQPSMWQPLSIDTNITYDLDKSKFPGLDDPENMQQPALLISTDDARDMWTHVLEVDEALSDSADDLFQLIEYCSEGYMDSSGSSDNSDYVESFLHNVLDSTGTDSEVSDDDVCLSESIWSMTGNETTSQPEIVWGGFGYYNYSEGDNKDKLEDPTETLKIVDDFMKTFDNSFFNFLDREA